MGGFGLEEVFVLWSDLTDLTPFTNPQLSNHCVAIDWLTNSLQGLVQDFAQEGANTWQQTSRGGANTNPRGATPILYIMGKANFQGGQINESQRKGEGEWKHPLPPPLKLALHWLADSLIPSPGYMYIIFFKLHVHVFDSVMKPWDKASWLLPHWLHWQTVPPVWCGWLISRASISSSLARKSLIIQLLRLSKDWDTHSDSWF